MIALARAVLPCRSWLMTDQSFSAQTLLFFVIYSLLMYLGSSISDHFIALVGMGEQFISGLPCLNGMFTVTGLCFTLFVSV